MMQRHAARYALNIYDRFAIISKMISILGWPTLESRHNTLRTVMMYKIMNNLVDAPTDTILFLCHQLHGCEDIATEKLQQLPCRVNAYAYSFLHKQLSYGMIYILQYLINSPDSPTF